MSMKLGEGHQHENVMNQPLIAGVNCYMFGSTCYGLSVAPINSWSHVVGPLQVSEKLKSRFMSCADGDNEENARLKRENLRSVLECTCLDHPGPKTGSLCFNGFREIVG